MGRGTSNLHVHVSLRDWLAAEVAVLEQRAGAQ